MLTSDIDYIHKWIHYGINESDNKVNECSAMCLSLCSRLCHWGPLVALGKRLKFDVEGIFLTNSLIFRHYQMGFFSNRLQQYHVLAHVKLGWYHQYDKYEWKSWLWCDYWLTFSFLKGFLVFSSLTTFHFFCAACDGPGYLPLEWKPDNECDTNYLQFCESCQGYKAPRAHHCRKCTWFFSLCKKVLY